MQNLFLFVFQIKNSITENETLSTYLVTRVDNSNKKVLD